MVGEGFDAGVEVGVAAVAGIGAGAGVAQVALAERVVEEDLLAAFGDDALERQRQAEVLLAAEGELERLERIQLLIGREPEVHAGDAVQGLGEVLDDGAGGERAQRPVARCAVAGPAGARTLQARHRGAQRKHMRHSAHDKFVLKVVEAVEVFEDQAELAHEPRVFEVFLKCRVELRDEQSIVGRQSGDECRVDRKVRLFAVATAAGAAVAIEGFVEEDFSALLDQRLAGVGGRRLAGRERDQAGQQRR
mgnify:CR=1 FL=1